MLGNGLNLTLVINSELEQNVNFLVGISDLRRHDPYPVHTKRRRYKFILRVGGTNRKHWSRKLAEKYREAKRIHRFREIQG